MNKLDEFKYNVEEVQKIWGRIIPNLRSWA